MDFLPGTGELKNEERVELLFEGDEGGDESECERVFGGEIRKIYCFCERGEKEAMGTSKDDDDVDGDGNLGGDGVEDDELAVDDTYCLETVRSSKICIATCTLY